LFTGALVGRVVVRWILGVWSEARAAGCDEARPDERLDHADEA